MNKETKVVATRVTPQLAELIKDICRRDAHVNPADFIRDAVREKIQRDAPELYSELFRIEKAPEGSK